MWYRLTVNVPADASAKSIWLYGPAVVNEAWVWVNGQYAGHRPHTMPWYRPQAVELDITPYIRRGQRNREQCKNQDKCVAEGILHNNSDEGGNAPERQPGASSAKRAKSTWSCHSPFICR